MDDKLNIASGCTFAEKKMGCTVCMGNWEDFDSFCVLADVYLPCLIMQNLGLFFLFVCHVMLC